MGSSPSVPKQADPVVEEEKAKKKALALAQAYEAKSAALGAASTKLAGTERNTEELKQDKNTDTEQKIAAMKNGTYTGGILNGKSGNANAGKKTALSGFEAYVPDSTDSKTASGTYDKVSRNERNQNSALLEYTRRKREPQALVVS